MRIVIDTNIAISGLIWHGPPRLVLDAARADLVTISSSPALMRELAGVLKRPKFAAVLTRNGTTAEELLDLYQDLVLIIEAPALETMISRDPDDDDVLACALAAHAMVITSGDRDLLDLGSFQGIPILTATALIQQLAHQPHVPDEPTLP